MFALPAAVIAVDEKRLGLGCALVIVCGPECVARGKELFLTASLGDPKRSSEREPSSLGRAGSSAAR